MNKLVFKLFYSKRGFRLFFLFSVVFLVACNAEITGQVPSEIAKNPEVYFCPRNDCGKVFEDKIDQADEYVYCAFYDLELNNMISSLSKKSNTADVKLIMERSNYDEQVKGDGIILDDNYQLMHNKFCVIDGNTVITGSFNPTDYGNNRNNNNVIVIYSTALAQNYKDEFDELWNGDFAGGKNVKYPVSYINNVKVENYFCPEDECASHVIDLINNAKSSVYFMTFSFTHEDVADALIRKDSLDIRGIFDSQQASNKYSQLKRLKDFGLNVKKDTEKYKMHHKVFIIDREIVVTGSFNPTLNGDENNDENMLVIHNRNMADVFLKEFDRLWG